MKKLMLTTAMCTGVAFAAVAQTAETDSAGTVPAFLSSDFTGKTLYTLDSADARAIGQDTDELTMAERDRLRWTSSDTFIADRDNWENVGAIDDIVMTQDGEIRGVLLDVGGFLGFGARTVKVDIGQLYFVTEEGTPEDIDDFFVVVAMTQDELENLPEWDEEQLRAGFEVRPHRDADSAMGATPEPVEDAAATDLAPMADEDGMEQAETDQAPSSNDSGMAAPATAIFTDEHQMLEGEERTADRLIGADVYDATGENIGAVDDVVIGADNGIEAVIVDVGGFLGIGAHTVSLPVDDAQIGWDDVDGDVRVQVSMTADQLEALPEYEG